jgi:chitin synthase
MFSLLVANLISGSVEADAKDVSTFIVNVLILEHAARLLGVAMEDSTQALAGKTNCAQKEFYAVPLGRSVLRTRPWRTKPNHAPVWVVTARIL